MTSEAGLKARQLLLARTLAQGEPPWKQASVPAGPVPQPPGADL